MMVVGERQAGKWGGWPLIMAFIRWPLIVGGLALIVLTARPPSAAAGLTVASYWASLVVTTVNVVNLALLFWRRRVEGFSLREMIGFRPESISRDLGLGFLWSFGLYALMTVGMMLTALIVLLTTGKTLADQFSPVSTTMPVLWPAWLTVLDAITFPLVNPLTEELNYRGYAQPRLVSSTGSVRAGILITSLGFGLQHMGFAFTPYAMPAFVAGFFLWGIGAGALVHRQKRLMIVLVAHFITNAAFGLVPLMYALLN